MTAGTENSDLATGGPMPSGHDFIARYCSGGVLPAGTWVERDTEPLMVVIAPPSPERSAELRERIAAAFGVEGVYAHPMMDGEVTEIVDGAKDLLAQVEALATSDLPESWGYGHRNIWRVFCGALRAFVGVMSRD